MRFFTSALAIVVLTSTTTACSGSSSGPLDSETNVEGDATRCANVACSGHGTCRSLPTSNGSYDAACFCDTGYVNEHDDRTQCVASSAITEGSGYLLDAEPSTQVVDAELEALAGYWYSSLRDWQVNEEDNDISTYGYVFQLPDYAGPATWRAADLFEARAGNARLVPPETESLTFGRPLGAAAGDLEGFRPLQFALAESPDQGQAAILYRRGEQEVSAPAGGTRKRAILWVVRCPDSFTSGVAKPKIEDCVWNNDGAERVPLGFVKEMFDN